MTAPKQTIYIVKKPGHPKYPVGTLVFPNVGRYETPDGKLYNLYNDSLIRVLKVPTTRSANYEEFVW